MQSVMEQDDGKKIYEHDKACEKEKVMLTGEKRKYYVHMSWGWGKK